MEGRKSFAFAGDVQLTVIGRQLHIGDPSPEYLDLVDGVVRTISLADLAELIRLLSVVNSLEHPLCQRVTRLWEVLSRDVSPEASVNSVSRDSPQMQARWQGMAGVLHQALSAQISERFGYDYSVWLKEWCLFQRAVFVIDRHDRLIYAEYLADQLREPDYNAALQMVRQAVQN